ncbi:hypothetical protein [Chromobacterium paludis]|uniref:Uncharacterized protein n=1 Tax=Chromobacterium paludis TaxID=2605945 RepID=A0A5C1DEX6_9NEIS|nr:hypothetical protein [Chromobacterium paludis]QEL55186.1 hypothetical protein FYK34_06210 [Chromobacterium paludis]
MSNHVTNWVADKLVATEDIEIVDRTPEDFLVVRAKDGYTFLVAVLGVQDVVGLSDVEPLFTAATKPQFVVNVPSKTLWSGSAINHIHAESAAFGTLGDVSRAANMGDAGSYRDKNMVFFINAMEQHSNVSSVTYIYGTVFKVDRKVGASLVVAVIDTYNMSAEDVRNTRSRFGHFDVVVKSTSYGSITSQAEAAAQSMGAQALTFRQLMGMLGN